MANSAESSTLMIANSLGLKPAAHDDYFQVGAIRNNSRLASVIDIHVEQDEMVQSDRMHRHDTTFTQEARPILISILVEHSVVEIEWEKILELNRSTKNEVDLGVF